ncbi:transposase [Nocardia sp. AG03]|uniref:transposase n=1 Tax=Nocardia sp. AG03 TaxID=3025312 RepID=UPI002418A513|nr:transposase [Nocardia sp. AG03]
MPRPRRSYSPEYRVEAAHRVIDSGRPVRDIARELDVHENLLHKWVREERRRMSAAGQDAAHGPNSVVGQELSSDEKAELVRLRAKVAERAKDIAFLEKASAYFAAKHPK